jgi:hypothetical protein
MAVGGFWAAVLFNPEHVRFGASAPDITLFNAICSSAAAKLSMS